MQSTFMAGMIRPTMTILMEANCCLYGMNQITKCTLISVSEGFRETQDYKHTQHDSMYYPLRFMLGSIFFPDAV